MKLRAWTYLIASGILLSTGSASAADPNAKILAAANDAVHSTAMNAAAQSMKTDVSPTHYDLLVRYNQAVDPESDARALLQAFISRLAKAGADPSGKVSINVCSIQTGLKTPTGKDAVRQLGCIHYNPFSEQVTFNAP